MRGVLAGVALVGLMGCDGGGGVGTFRPDPEAKVRNRLALLKGESEELKVKLKGHQTRIGAPPIIKHRISEDVARDVPTDYAALLREERHHRHYTTDGEYRAVLARLDQVVIEHNALMDEHPAWRGPRLTDDLNAPFVPPLADPASP